MKQHKGFTLIEFMIVVAIIGILLAIAFPAYQKYIYKTYLAENCSEEASKYGFARSEMKTFYETKTCPKNLPVKPKQMTLAELQAAFEAAQQQQAIKDEQYQQNISAIQEQLDALVVNGNLTTENIAMLQQSLAQLSNARDTQNDAMASKLRELAEQLSPSPKEAPVTEEIEKTSSADTCNRAVTNLRTGTIEYIPVKC